MKTAKRRRREYKTDYLKRLKLLKSNYPRIVFRRTNKYIIAQYVTSKQAQDKIDLGVNSKSLMKYGWPKKSIGSLKSIPASYLTGLLMGRKITKENIKGKIIVDFGMYRVMNKKRIYAFLKGLIDSGVKLKYKEENFPSEERIKGEHLKNKIPFNDIKFNIEKN